jgi:hypothetical protein
MAAMLVPFLLEDEGLLMRSGIRRYGIRNEYDHFKSYRAARWLLLRRAVHLRDEHITYQTE